MTRVHCIKFIVIGWPLYVSLDNAQNTLFIISFCTDTLFSLQFFDWFQLSNIRGNGPNFIITVTKENSICGIFPASPYFFIGTLHNVISFCLYPQNFAFFHYFSWCADMFSSVYHRKSVVIWLHFLYLSLFFFPALALVLFFHSLFLIFFGFQCYLFSVFFLQLSILSLFFVFSFILFHFLRHVLSGTIAVLIHWLQVGCERKGKWNHVNGFIPESMALSLLGPETKQRQVGEMEIGK